MLTETKHSSGLPGGLQRYFWDVAFDDLTIEKYPQFIAARIMNYGDLDGIKWLLSWADKEYIRTIIEKSRNLNAKTKNYWQIMLTDITN